MHINDYIKTSSNKLNLEQDVIEKAIQIYESVYSNQSIQDTRIHPKNLAIASIYIADNIISPNPQPQNTYVYKLQISFATLRKTYKLICEILDIPRSQIVSPQYFSTSKPPSGE